MALAAATIGAAVGGTGKIKLTGDTGNLKIDENGKIKVSAKQCLEKPEGYVEPQRNSRPRREGRSDRRDNNNVERRVFKKNKAE